MAGGVARQLLYTSLLSETLPLAARAEIDLECAGVPAAWGVADDFQRNAGLNFGLNRYTPGVQAYFGASRKF